MLNPLAFMDEAQIRALKSRDETKQSKPESPEPGVKTKPKETTSDTKSKLQKPSSGKKPSGSGKPKVAKQEAL